MRHARLRAFPVALVLATTACLIEPNPDFAVAEDDDCVVGQLDCMCTPGGGCDPGLECIADVCGTGGDGTGGDGTGGDGTGGDGTGDIPYGLCPSGDDADCGDFEVCVTGSDQGTTWSLCTIPCSDPDDCAVDGWDDCSNLPGDGEFKFWCVPVINCGVGNPCPTGMRCLMGTLLNSPTVCVWPDPWHTDRPVFGAPP